ncbi:MAG: hypothetical protein AMJ75_00530 [Phycisphaerae bacterium SM1_79]|nr:MAG: hypothetical protein AMJ75_00530 [Phycisphaerae bacterium SM1_79]
MNHSKRLDIDKLYSLEAEAGVLGSMIIDPGCIAKVLPMLPRSDALYLPEHRTIYEALVKVYVANKPIDAISLRTELKEQGKLDEIGGVQYIAKIMESVPSSANAVYYAGIVRAKEKERQVLSAVETVARIPDEPGGVDEKIRQIQDIALELEPTKSGPDFVEVSKVATEIAGAMRDHRDGAVATGFNDLDELIHGFYAGEFAILAGRPSIGKSALMLDMALNMAKAGTGVLVFSLEMAERALIERAICNLACVDATKTQSGTAAEDDWNEIYKQAFELRNLNIILSKVGGTPEQVAGLIHRLKQTHNIQIAFIDYLQLMTTGKKSESRQQEVTTISRKLKAIALREDVPLVVLSQLNRQVDAREDHRPRMSDLRESGSIEQDADLVLFVYRADYYQKDEPDFQPSGLAEVIVSKNRRGPVGKAKLVFVHDYCKFSDLSPNYVGAM